MNTSAAIEAAHLLDRLERLARSEETAGVLNPAQWEALRFVARANRFSRTPAALAEYLGSTRGTVSQTLIALEQKKHVRREANARDRRSVVIELTPVGKRALQNDPILSLAADLTAANPDKLDDLIETLRGVLQAKIARGGGRPFGVCHSCRHFRKGEEAVGQQSHHCALVDEPLSEAESYAICVEQEPMQAAR